MKVVVANTIKHAPFHRYTLNLISRVMIASPSVIRCIPKWFVHDNFFLQQKGNNTKKIFAEIYRSFISDFEVKNF